jgi:hypothetical protein
MTIRNLQFMFKPASVALIGADGDPAVAILADNLVGAGFAGKLFAEQDKWMAPFAAMSPAETQAIALVPQTQQPARMAQAAGLDRWAAERGVSLATGKACLLDTKAQERLNAIRNDALTTYKLEGTPTFGINGVPVQGAIDWANLEPKLQAALK